MQESGLKTVLLGGGAAVLTGLHELLEGRRAWNGIAMVVASFTFEPMTMARLPRSVRSCF